MSKELKLLNASIDNERHVYTWKQMGSLRMFLMWLAVGITWLYLLWIVKLFGWGFHLILYSYFILQIIYGLYRSVLKTSIEVNPNELLTTKTPFNLKAKNIPLDKIKRVYYLRQGLSWRYEIWVELKRGLDVKVLSNFKKCDAIQIADQIDSSVKHFQKVRLTTNCLLRVNGNSDYTEQHILK